jgi:hypothetical protein
MRNNLIISALALTLVGTVYFRGFDKATSVPVVDNPNIIAAPEETSTGGEPLGGIATTLTDFKNAKLSDIKSAKDEIRAGTVVPFEIREYSSNGVTGYQLIFISATGTYAYGYGPLASDFTVPIRYFTPISTSTP